MSKSILTHEKGSEKMFFHCILTAQSYTQKKRMAIDIVMEPGHYTDEFEAVKHKVDEANIHSLPTSVHMKTVDGPAVSDLKKADPYFEGVEFYDSVDAFIEDLRSDEDLSSLDIAKYILAKLDCSHLKLEKLVYYCYADYLTRTGKKLFQDQIFAFKYGPIAHDVYTKCKSISELEYDKPLRESVLPSFGDRTETIYESRILHSKDGVKVLSSIDDTLKKYADLSANTLVRLTHKEDSPWANAYVPGINWMPINDAFILQKHHVDSIS
jgi:uncharacterized phage-associated protein